MDRYLKELFCLIKRMVKFSACSLIISSFTPFHSIILKNPRRFSTNIPYYYSTKSRIISSYTQNAQLHTEDTMVARRYSPPLFRYIINLLFFFLGCFEHFMNENLNENVFWLYWCSIAPMMEWTDNHYRTLARLISKHAWLYTEMLAAETIVYQKGNLVS